MDPNKLAHKGTDKNTRHHSQHRKYDGFIN